MNLTTLDDQFAKHLTQQQTILIICAHGVRSAQACQMLCNHGYKDIVNVEGGITAYPGKIIVPTLTSCKQIITQKLKKAFHPDSLEVIDESSLHKGHFENKGKGESTFGDFL